jgi:hypothetical protein
VSSTYVSAALRRLVIARARSSCEYCLIHDDDTFHGCQVDHVVSEKHGGPTEEGNLALACSACNRRKGSDIGSIVPESGRFVRLFNPRTDAWDEHFTFDERVLSIVPLTEIGTVTVRVLGLNEPDRLLERRFLHAAGRYPPHR